MHERELRKTITAYGIKTIINLRGMSSSPSYLEELKVANELGVRHVDIEISARQLPPPEKVEELLKTFAKGPYPILVHCSGGADRSGLASVLYRVICEDEPFTSALKEQLTWRYGHFAVGQRRAMDDFFKLYLQTGAKKDFAQWIIEDYPEVYLRYGQK
jgi:protein tyrosine/serine phosphatase